MANSEHVEIVKQGAEAITAWREKNLHRRLDLKDADLRHADLKSASLIHADLTVAQLSHANMSDASLNFADLSGANLRHANFSGADLTNADLDMADLSGAELTRATLWSTNLGSVELEGTKFAGVYLGNTKFGNVNLSETKGLGEVCFSGPCTIGVDTLFRSQGKIPAEFLRGCGVPEALITQLPAIIASMEPIQFYSCFISYSSDDDTFARRLYARLKAEKLQVFFAPEDMKGGEKSAEQINTAIQVHDRLLLVLSEKSMSSEWVRREIERAREKEKRGGRNVLFPIALVPYETIRLWECLDVDSGEDLAKKVREYQIPDFSQWKQEDAFEKALADLLDDLKAKAEG